MLVILILLAVVPVLAFAEYRSRRIYRLSGHIYPCQYVQAIKSCILFESSDKRRFVLTPASILRLTALGGANNFDSRLVGIKANILGQKIPVKENGSLNRLKILEIAVIE